MCIISNDKLYMRRNEELYIRRKEELFRRNAEWYTRWMEKCVF
jgi:hypothetical protein